MPVVHHYRCAAGHTTRALVAAGVDEITCRVPDCGLPAPKFWGGAWRGRSIGEGNIHDVHGLGKVTTEELNAHLAEMKARTGRDYVVEPATKSSVQGRIDDIDHECWVLDQAEGESKERQAERAKEMAEVVAPAVQKVREAGGSGRDQYNAMKSARAQFNVENPTDF